MKPVKKIFIPWVIIMFFITFICCLVYTIEQQSLRIGANEMPVQLATDTAIKLQDGQNVNNAIPADKIDISRSLSTFVMVFDNNKNLIAESGMMGTDEPNYPKGVLNSVDEKGEARVTWQPKAGLRYATVAIKYKDGYIVGARSLNETEKLIDLVGRLVLYAWLACTVFSALGAVIIYYFLKRIDMINK